MSLDKTPVDEQPADARSDNPEPVVDEPAVDEPAAAETDVVEVGESAPSSGGRGRRLLVVSALVAVALAAFAVVAAFQPGAPTNRAWVDGGATVEVTEAATTAIESMHRYSFETVDEDFEQMRSVLTPKMQEEFDVTAQVTKEAILQTRTATDVQVQQLGVSMLDGDRAEVAAYIMVSATGDGIVQDSAAAPVSVSMTKIDGRWLISELRDQ